MARSSIISHPLSRRQVLKGGAALGFYIEFILMHGKKV